MMAYVKRVALFVAAWLASVRAVSPTMGVSIFSFIVRSMHFAWGAICYIVVAKTTIRLSLLVIALAWSVLVYVAGHHEGHKGAAALRQSMMEMSASVAKYRIETEAAVKARDAALAEKKAVDAELAAMRKKPADVPAPVKKAPSLKKSPLPLGLLGIL